MFLTRKTYMRKTNMFYDLAGLSPSVHDFAVAFHRVGMESPSPSSFIRALPLETFCRDRNRALGPYLLPAVLQTPHVHHPHSASPLWRNWTHESIAARLMALVMAMQSHGRPVPRPMAHALLEAILDDAPAPRSTPVSSVASFLSHLQFVCTLLDDGQHAIPVSLFERLLQSVLEVRVLTGLHLTGNERHSLFSFVRMWCASRVSGVRSRTQ